MLPRFDKIDFDIPSFRVKKLCREHCRPAASTVGTYSSYSSMAELHQRGRKKSVLCVHVPSMWSQATLVFERKHQSMIDGNKNE